MGTETLEMEEELIRLIVAVALIGLAAPAFAGQSISYSADENGNTIVIRVTTPDVVFVPPPPPAHFQSTKVTRRDLANGDIVIRRTITTEKGSIRTTRVVDRPSLGFTRSHGTGWSGGKHR